MSLGSDLHTDSSNNVSGEQDPFLSEYVRKFADP